MADKFDPAPHDKHAEDPKAAARADSKRPDQLDKDLEDTFPASDPPSETQPERRKTGD